MLVDPPATRRPDEALGHHVGGLEPTPAERPRHPHPRLVEADDVEPAVARDVGQESGVAIDPPATGSGAEVVDDESGRAEGAVAAGRRHPDAVVAEPDDVGPAVAGEVHDEPQVVADPPTAGVVAEVGEASCGR